MYLDGVQHFDHAGMPKGAELLESVLREGQASAVGCDVEGEYTAVGSIFLFIWSAKARILKGGTRFGVAYSSCAIVQCPDGLVEIDDVPKSVGEGRPLRYGGCDCRL